MVPMVSSLVIARLILPYAVYSVDVALSQHRTADFRPAIACRDGGFQAMEQKAGRACPVSTPYRPEKEHGQFGWGICHNRLSEMTLPTKKACFCISYSGTTLW
jgi:hypothetical protein